VLGHSDALDQSSDFDQRLVKSGRTFDQPSARARPALGRIWTGAARLGDMRPLIDRRV
jgi:hypothetical protein